MELLPSCFELYKNWLPNHTELEKSLRLEIDPYLKCQLTWSKGWPARKTYAHKMARFGDNGITYSFKDKVKPVHAWTNTQIYLKQLIELEFNFKSNCAVANLYSAEGDLHPHKDSTYITELGKYPTIISLSFAETRTLLIYEIDKKGKKIEPALNVVLEPGDLFIMKNEADEKYMHGIKPELDKIGERLSLTFRHHKINHGT